MTSNIQVFKIRKVFKQTREFYHDLAMKVREHFFCKVIFGYEGGGLVRAMEKASIENNTCVSNKYLTIEDLGFP